jgi:activator of 2-hydroxyglutaryl-CoA dehydratase
VVDQITFTGGVSRNTAMVAALEERVGHRLNVSEDCQYIGALGAALFAQDRILAGRAPVEVGA